MYQKCLAAVRKNLVCGAISLQGEVPENAPRHAPDFNKWKHKMDKKAKRNLSETIKGMQVKNWEVREHSDGKRVVYVRFTPKEPTLTVNVKEG